jgi:hypothetical protein
MELARQVRALVVLRRKAGKDAPVDEVPLGWNSTVRSRVLVQQEGHPCAVTSDCPVRMNPVLVRPAEEGKDFLDISFG